MEAELVKVSKLKNAENWNIWKFQIRIMLISNSVLDIVKGDKAKPTPPSAEDVAANAALTAQYAKNLEEWTKNDGIAQRIIATTVEKTPMLHIINLESAKEMWDKLHEVFENKTEVSIHMLQQKWFSYTKDPADDMSTHISKLEDLCYKLKALDENISDSMLITKIIMTLPPTYNHFISAWESTSENLRTVENLTSRLIMEETRINSQDDQSVALITKRFGKNFSTKDNKNKNDERGNKNQGSAKNSQNSRECWNCGKYGHARKNCWFLKKDSKPNFKENKQSHNNNENKALVVEVLLSANQNIDRSSSWLLDSGASSHMSENKAWFSEYEELKNQVGVRLGDGNLLYAEGKGKIEIEAFNGKVWVDKYLSQVLYIPGIKFNLFSMGAALSKNINLE